MISIAAMPSRLMLWVLLALALVDSGCGERTLGADMDRAGLQQLRRRAHFREWEGYVPARHISASRAVMTRLVDEVLALGADPRARSVEAAIDRAVEAFNELDRRDGQAWIMTIEREAIVDALCETAELAGLAYDREELVGDRDW